MNKLLLVIASLAFSSFVIAGNHTNDPVTKKLRNNFKSGSPIILEDLNMEKTYECVAHDAGNIRHHSGNFNLKFAQVDGILVNSLGSTTISHFVVDETGLAGGSLDSHYMEFRMIQSGELVSEFSQYLPYDGPIFDRGRSRSIVSEDMYASSYSVCK
jgi:hypothetical protein